ncbi:hypothetical protein D3C87_1884560 [compost metagenome]
MGEYILNGHGYTVLLIDPVRHFDAHDGRAAKLIEIILNIDAWHLEQVAPDLAQLPLDLRIGIICPSG